MLCAADRLCRDTALHQAGNHWKMNQESQYILSRTGQKALKGKLSFLGQAGLSSWDPRYHQRHSWRFLAIRLDGAISVVLAFPMFSYFYKFSDF